MSSIAYENGFFWKTLWNLGQNADLKAKRKNPNVLMEGDTVHIPDLTIRQEPGATEATHKFMLKGVPEILRMKLLDANHKPRANLSYTIIIEGVSKKGTTDGKGELKESIPPNAKSGQLIIPSCPDKNGKPIPGKPPMRTLNLQLGNLNPITELTGFKSRLANLGFYKGPSDNNLDTNTKQAIRGFQRTMGLPVTGVADAATQAQLQGIHGH